MAMASLVSDLGVSLGYRARGVHHTVDLHACGG
jgi:hypothetical protein